MAKVLICFALIIFLSACGQKGLNIPPQQWQDFWIQVETRPSTPAPGMNEFIVILTDARRRPVTDVVVSLNTQGDWKQAIPDGHVGVFRRALMVSDPANDRLRVKLKRRDKQQVLEFNLHSPPGGTTR